MWGYDASGRPVIDLGDAGTPSSTRSWMPGHYSQGTPGIRRPPKRADKVRVKFPLWRWRVNISLRQAVYWLLAFAAVIVALVLHPAREEASRPYNGGVPLWHTLLAWCLLGWAFYLLLRTLKGISRIVLLAAAALLLLILAFA